MYGLGREVWLTGVLEDDDHAESTGLVGVVDVVDGGFGAAACCFDDLGGVGGEVEVACRVDASVGLVATDLRCVSRSPRKVQDSGNVLTRRAPDEDDMVGRWVCKTAVIYLGGGGECSGSTVCLVWLTFLMAPFMLVAASGLICFTSLPPLRRPCASPHLLILLITKPSLRSH